MLINMNGRETSESPWETTTAFNWNSNNNNNNNSSSSLAATATYASSAASSVNENAPPPFGEVYAKSATVWQKISFVIFSVFCFASLYIFVALTLNEFRSHRVITKKGVKYLR